MEFGIILIFLTVILVCVVSIPFVISWCYLEHTKEGREQKVLNKLKRERKSCGTVVVIMAASRRRSLKAYQLASGFLLTMSSTFSKKIKTTHFENGSKFQVGKDVLYVCCGDIQILDKLRYQIDKIYFDSDFTPQVQKMILKPSLFKRNKVEMDWDIFFEDEKNGYMTPEERISLWQEEHKEKFL